MEDFTFSAEYARFIMPTEEELWEDRMIYQMSDTERELYYLRKDMRDGKINRIRYQEAVECSLWWAVEDKKITKKECDRLYKHYGLSEI